VGLLRGITIATDFGGVVRWPRIESHCPRQFARLAGRQPFSPPLCCVDSRLNDVFRVGEKEATAAVVLGTHMARREGQRRLGPGGETGIPQRWSRPLATPCPLPRDDCQR